MKNIEMHCHTVASDGLQTNEERFSEAQSKGIEFLAITDHDRVSRGLDELAQEYGVQTCEAVEISAINNKNGKSLHLTLYAHHISHEIDNILQNTLDAKVGLIEKQINKLNTKGFSIDLQNFYDFILAGGRKKEGLNKFDIARYLFETKNHYNLVQKIEPGIKLDDFYLKFFKTEGEKFPEYGVLIPDYEPILEVCKDMKEKSNGILALPHSNFTFKGGIEEFEEQLPDYIENGGVNALEINCLATKQWVEAIINAKNKYGLYLTFGSDCHTTGFADNKHGELGEKNPHITDEFTIECFNEYKDILKKSFFEHGKYNENHHIKTFQKKNR